MPSQPPETGPSRQDSTLSTDDAPTPTPAHTLSRHYSTLSLSRLSTTLTRSPTTPPSLLWHQALSHLSAPHPNIPRFLSHLKRIPAHKHSTSTQRARAATILALLAVAPYLPSALVSSLHHHHPDHTRKPIPRRVLAKLANALKYRSADIAALTLHLHVARRIFSPIPIPQLLLLVQQAARSHHPYAQALFAAIQARIPPFHTLPYQSIPTLAPPTSTTPQASLQASAAHGCPLALDLLYQSLQSPRKHSSTTTTISPTHYFSLVQSAASLPVADAHIRLANLFRKGIGCPNDHLAATQSIRHAAALNLPSAVTAAWRDAVADNLHICARLAHGGNLAKDDAKTLKANKDLIDQCRLNTEHWIQSGTQGQIALVIHRLCVLTGEVKPNLAEVLSTLVRERDQEGWTCAFWG